MRIYPTDPSIRDDLFLLKSVGFDGVITYECSGPLESIASIAHELGLRVIQGVWGPVDKRELARAVLQHDLVDAYCVGNEGLNLRYTIRELDEGAVYVSNHTGLPVAISEQVHLYFQDPKLIQMGDWLFPIVHPHFGHARTYAAATQWVDTMTTRLQAEAAKLSRPRPLFIKEIGMPSAGDPEYSEESQAGFLGHMLAQRKLRFALFEAFDRSGWEYISPVEPYWGVFHQNRAPKPILSRLQDLLAKRRQIAFGRAANQPAE